MRPGQVPACCPLRPKLVPRVVRLKRASGRLPDGAERRTTTPMTDRETPRLFDRTLLQARQQRALRQGSAPFLLDHVAADMAQRLQAVLRDFEHGIDLGTPGDQVQPGLGKGEPDEERGALFADTYSTPAPYVELEDQAHPLARQLSEALQLLTPETRLEPHDNQGRYSFRQEVRTPDTPHLLVQSMDSSPRDLALYLLVDRSGSISTIQDEVRLALMMLYLAGTELEIPTGVTYFGAHENNRAGQGMEVTPPTPAASESVKALIAGFEGTTNC